MFVAPELVKMQEFRGRAVEVMRIREMQMFDQMGPLPEFKAERCILEAQRLALAESSFNVAFDPESGTLWISDPVDAGFLMYQARHEEELGRPLPFQREVARHDAMAQSARADADRALSEQQKLKRVLSQATERLTSNKPGVRRRAKRLIRKLASQ